MNFCEQCGSSSRDRSGFCGGCGALWPQPDPDPGTDRAASKRASPFSTLPRKFSSSALVDVRPKQVWAAVALALLFGPIGLLYCTITGTIVMTIVSIAVTILFGYTSSFLILPVCAIWAWRAARESASLFD